MAIAFSQRLTCRKSLGCASIGSRGGQLFEFRCLGICKVGPGIDKFQGTKKWLGSILEAIEEDEVTFSLESAPQRTFRMIGRTHVLRHSVLGTVLHDEIATSY
jgi:hypothetical protein